MATGRLSRPGLHIVQYSTPMWVVVASRVGRRRPVVSVVLVTTVCERPAQTVAQHSTDGHRQTTDDDTGRRPSAVVRFGRRPLGRECRRPSPAPLLPLSLGVSAYVCIYGPPLPTGNSNFAAVAAADAPGGIDRVESLPFSRLYVNIPPHGIYQYIISRCRPAI